MKTTIFTEVLDETVIEVNEPKATLIKKLMAQERYCRELDSDGNMLRFSCAKNGTMAVSNSADGNPFYIRGEVCEQDGKTVVKLYSVRSRGTPLFIIVLAIWAIFIGAYYTAKIVTEYDFVPSDFYLLAPPILFFFVFLAPLKKAHKYKDADLEIMKGVVINRIEAIKRWDD